jgi:hypothetical protein
MIIRTIMKLLARPSNMAAVLPACMSPA